MKYGLGIFTVIALLSLALAHAQAQTPAPVQPTTPTTLPGALDPTSPPVSPTTSIPTSGGNAVRNPDPVSPAPPGSTPTTPTTSGAAPPPVAETMTWTTRALAEELALVAQTPEAKPKKKKGGSLSEKNLAELRSKAARNEADIKSRVRIAEHFEAKENWEKVVETLRPVAADLSRKGFLQLARAYRNLNDFKEEIRILESLRAKKERDYFVQYSLGLAYSSYGNRLGAIERFEAAKKINPRFAPAYEALLRETLREARWSDALEISQDLVGKFGEKAKYMRDLCLLYAYQAFLERGEEVCRRAITKDPKIASNHVVLGFLVKERMGTASGEKILNKAAQQFTRSELAQWAAGELAWEKKDQISALKYYRAAVKANPKSARSQIGRARAAFEEKQYPEALEAFVQACTFNRVYVQDLRKSASALRRADNLDWHSKYESALGRCGIP